MVTDNMRWITLGVPDDDPCWLIVCTTFSPEDTKPNNG
jgi:hypothetical protein